MSPPASMIACLAGGSGVIGNDFPVVLLTTSVAPTSSSSPSDASIPGQITVFSPRLHEFCRKMRANPLATTVSSYPFRHEAACSRDDPHPKLLSATMTLPPGTCPALRRALNSKSAKANCGVSVGSTVAMNRPG
jgi:hypothetical protein